MKLVVVIPTYNEAGHLGALLESLFALHLPDVELHALVVDDASPDGTAEIAAAAATRWPGRVDLVRRPAKQGLTSAYVAGFTRALASGADYVAQMDADGSHDPAELPRMLAVLGEADVVIGSRYAAGDSQDTRRGRYRRTASRIGGRLVGRVIAGLSTSDPTSGFRLWRAAALQRIDPARRLRSRDYGLQVELALLAAAGGCRSVDHPIHFAERRAGRSKMTLAVQVRTIGEIVRASLAHRRGKGRSR